jgi:hypothetical protein
MKAIKDSRYTFRVSVSCKCKVCNFEAHTHKEIDEHLKLGHDFRVDDLNKWFEIRDYEFNKLPKVKVLLI